MSEALQQLIHQAEEQKLQIEMQLLFDKNLSLFQQRFPGIYKLLKSHRPTNVVLKLDPNRQINLVDVSARAYIYNGIPRDICKQQIAEFTKDARVRRFRVVKSPEQNERHLHIQGLNALIDQYTQKEAPRQKTTPKLISNLVISGIGLGYHLQDVIAEHDIQNIFLYENCVDSFFGSMHTIDWTAIVNRFTEDNKSIAFCIGITPEQALAQIETAIHQIGLHSHIFTFVIKHTQRQCETDFIDTYMKEIRSFVGGLGYFDDERIGLAHAYHNLKSNHPVFVSRKTHKRKTRVLIVGNGPSLDDHKEYLEKNQDNVVIISCGTALTSLIRMGIKPDFHVEMERPSFIEEVLNLGTSKEERKGITLLCLHTVSPKTIACFDDAAYAIKPNDAGTPLVHEYFHPEKISELAFSNPTVTNCALSFAASMGFMDVHLVGVDLGIPDSGKHHSEKSIYYDIARHKSNLDKKKPVKKQTHYREANFGGEIKTTPVLDNSRSAMERLLEFITRAFPDFRCINSNSGVKIKNTLTVAIEDLEKCAQTNKDGEIANIREDHFLSKNQEQYNEHSAKKLLKHFYNSRFHLKLPLNIKSEKELLQQTSRVFKEVSRSKDVLTHYLLRGTLNCYLGTIVEHSLYCENADDFAERVKVGDKAYNQLIDDIYTSMENDPFEIDDTISPKLREMYLLKQKETEQKAEEKTKEHTQ